MSERFWTLHAVKINVGLVGWKQMDKLSEAEYSVLCDKIESVCDNIDFVGILQQRLVDAGLDNLSVKIEDTI